MLPQKQVTAAKASQGFTPPGTVRTRCDGYYWKTSVFFERWLPSCKEMNEGIWIRKGKEGKKKNIKKFRRSRSATGSWISVRERERMRSERGWSRREKVDRGRVESASLMVIS